MIKDYQLIEFLTRLRDCGDYESSWQLYTQAVSELGFTHNGYMLMPNGPAENGTMLAFSNYQPEFISAYVELGGAENDDTVQWIQATDEICHWSNPTQRSLCSEKYLPLEELSQDFNVLNGVTIPMKPRHNTSTSLMGLSATNSSQQEYERDVIPHLDLAMAMTQILEMHFHQFEPHQMMEGATYCELQALSPLEQETIRWLSSGCSIKEVADKKLFKSIESVNIYIKNAKQKLQVRTRDQLIACAVLLGLV